MLTQLVKWGDSHAVRLPKSILEEVKWPEGARLVLSTTEDGAIVIRQNRKRDSLAELVGAITPENSPTETDWGEPQGKEAW